MHGFLFKVIACPLILALVSYASPQLRYGSMYQPILVGVIIALFGQLMEAFVLKKGTVWISTAVDFGVAALIIYFGSNLLPGARVTWMGAIVTALVIAVAEYFTHAYLVEKGHVES